MRFDGPLDMRMNPTIGISAADWLAQADEASLIRVLREYGEVPNARRLAQAILARQQLQPFQRTLELATFLEEERSLFLDLRAVPEKFVGEPLTPRHTEILGKLAMNLKGNMLAWIGFTLVGKAEVDHVVLGLRAVHASRTHDGLNISA